MDEKVLALLDKCRITDAFEVHDTTAQEKQREVQHYLEKLPTNEDYRFVFHLISDVNKQYVYQDWTIISLKQIFMDYEALQKSNINENVCLFAYSYIGMGHTINIYYNKLTDSFFMTRGGGSNGWEQEANLNFLKNIIAPLNKSLTMSEVLDLIVADYDTYIEYLHSDD